MPHMRELRRRQTREFAETDEGAAWIQTYRKKAAEGMSPEEIARFARAQIGPCTGFDSQEWAAIVVRELSKDRVA